MDLRGAACDLCRDLAGRGAVGKSRLNPSEASGRAQSSATFSGEAAWAPFVTPARREPGARAKPPPVLNRAETATPDSPPTVYLRRPLVPAPRSSPLRALAHLRHRRRRSSSPPPCAHHRRLPPSIGGHRVGPRPPLRALASPCWSSPPHSLHRRTQGGLLVPAWKAIAFPTSRDETNLYLRALAKCKLNNAILKPLHACMTYFSWRLVNSYDALPHSISSFLRSSIFSVHLLQPEGDHKLPVTGLYEDSILYDVRAVSMNPKADNAWQYLRISLGNASRADMIAACDARNLDALQKEFPL